MISLLIPFGFNDPRRQEIFLWNQTRWTTLFPDWQLCLGIGDPENYNRSAARNRAFEQAEGDILVITDADTATTPDNVERAIQICQQENRWVIAHHVYHSLTEEFTDWLLTQPPDVPLDYNVYRSHWTMIKRSEAGVLVVPRAAYEAVEGYDERFMGWGYEDQAFAVKLRRTWGIEARTDGHIAHLWHDPGLNFQQPHIHYNEALLEKIRTCTEPT